MGFSSKVSRLRDVPQTGEPVEVAQVFPIAVHAVAPPGAFAQPFQYPPALHGLAELRRRVRRGLFGLRGRNHAGCEITPQLSYPMSMPLEQRRRGSGRRRRREGRRRRARCLAGHVHERVGPRRVSLAARQRLLQRLFLAPP